MVIKKNYSLDNLEWCSPKQNMEHSRKTGLHKTDGDKPVLQIKNNVIINEYKSASEASRLTGIKRCNICTVCRGYDGKKNHYTAGGYEWKWKN